MMMTQLNILVIAPKHADLSHVAAEVTAYKRNHQVTALEGVVRDLDIANAVEEGPYDVVVFASHGHDSGIELSDSLLGLEAAQQYVKRSGATLVVLNTCDSESVGYQLLGDRCDVIFTISDVGDADAVRFSVLLASALTRCDEYKEAFEQSVGRGSKYRFLSAKSAGVRSAAARRDDDELREMVYSMRTEVAVHRTLLIMMLIGLVLVGAIELLLWFRVGSLA